MGYEKEVLQRARARYAAQVEAHRSAHRQAQQEIYEDLPEAMQLENRIRATMAEVIAKSLRHGEDPSPAIRSIRDKNLRLQDELHALLLENGYDTDALDDQPMCSICRDQGYVGETMCSCLDAICQEEQRKELTSLLDIDVSFDDFCLDYYPEAVNPSLGISSREQMENNYEICVEFANHFPNGPDRNLLLNGAPGLGKTFLSACIAREVVSRGHSVVYDTAIHLFSCMEKQKFGGGTPEELRMAERILECDLLILDDLGTEMSTSFIPAALYTIVNTRLMTKRSTIISTNLSVAQLGQRYGAQIDSRISGEYCVLPFFGNDLRDPRNRRAY